MAGETDGGRAVVTREDVAAAGCPSRSRTGWGSPARRRAVEMAQRCARAGVPVPPVPPFLLDCRLAGLVRLLIERGLITAEELDAAAAEEQARTLEALLARAGDPQPVRDRLGHPAAAPGLLVPSATPPGRG